MLIAVDFFVFPLILRGDYSYENKITCYFITPGRLSRGGGYGYKNKCTCCFVTPQYIKIDNIKDISYISL